MSTLKLTRRSFIKTLAVSGAAAGTLSDSGLLNTLAHAQTAPEAAGEVTRIRTACRGCGKMECGVWVVLKNGRPIKIEGDKTCLTSEGNSCSKSQASIQALYHPDRIMYPVKRTRPKGQNPGWVRISWDEAMSTSAKRFEELRSKYGPHAIRAQHGTSRIYTRLGMNLVRSWGGANHGGTAGQICKGPRILAGALTCFAGAYWMALVDGVDVFVQWGTATETSNYDDSAAVTIDRRWKAKKHIVVGPIQQNLGAQADIWLPLRPGTDGAMALGWLNVIISEKKYDEAFLKQWSNAPFLYSDDLTPSGFKWELAQNAGTYPLDIKTRLVKESDLKQGGSPKKFAYWDKKRNAVGYFDSETSKWDKDYKTLDIAMSGSYTLKDKNGKNIKADTVWDRFTKVVSAYTPEKVGEICRVKPELIREAAHEYAKYEHGGGIHHQLAIEHNGNGTQTCRNVLLIAALTGNIDNKGGHRGGEATAHLWQMIIPSNKSNGMPPLTPEARKMVAGSERFPLMPWITTLGSAAVNHDHASVTDMMLTGKPYPVRGQLSMTGSHFHSSNAVKNWEGQKTLDFNFGSELWFSPSIELCDIVVPTTHWLETKAPRPSMGAHGGLGYMPIIVNARAECRPDEDITLELAKRTNTPWWNKETADKFSGGNQWPSIDQMLDRCFSPLGMNEKEFAAKFQRDGWMDYKKLNPKGWGTYNRYEIGEMRPDKLPGFPTPTTKLELMSTIIESYHPKGEEWPVYHEPPLSKFTKRGEELAKQYPLTMINGQRVPVYFHNEHRQVPFLRELYPVPRLKINPATAKKLGIADGDWVWIENHKGKIRMCAELFEGTAEDVVSGDHQWWYPELPAPEHGCHLSNINVLVDEYAQDPLCGASNLRAFPVKVYKAAEGAPEGIITSSDHPQLKKWLPQYPKEV